MSSSMVKYFGLFLYSLGLKKWAARLFITTTMNPAGLQGLYINFIEHCQAGIRDALRIIGDQASQPILIHCTQGKDRTGLVIALTLHILGVPDEVILEDYQISREGLEPEVSAMLQEMQTVGLDPQFLDSPPDAMKATFAHIKTKYGSVDRYLDGIGFKNRNREQLRRALRQPR